ncbi:MAG: CPBP family intramembrane metalloprotease [Duncaniella sp.]|nr:CPBP family intramembrane metalloprotease [Duncaniella sp.]
MNTDMVPGSSLLRVSTVKAIMILLVTCLIFMMIIGAVMHLIPMPLTTRTMRVLAVVQDMFMFILPAAVTAVIVSPYPGRLLDVDRRPSVSWALMGILALLTAIPAMNWLVEWNEHISLPEVLSGLEAKMKTYEATAQDSVKILMGGTSTADLIMGILIIGIFAGVSEELFFRGALLGCMIHSRMNKHLAIWITAIVFSLFHLQFYGFFPRVLLGAYFGYIVWWTGSVWVSAIIHAFNNSVIVAAEWMSRAGFIDYDINHTDSSSIALIIGSIILTGGILRAAMKHLGKKEETGRAD